MVLQNNLRPVWAEISLDNLKHNIKQIKNIVKKDTIVCAVVKADGYGHGAVQVAKVLLNNGAERLAVATLIEAVQLRKAGYKVPIIILGYTPEEQGKTVLDYEIIQTVYSYNQALAFSNIAKENNKHIKIHLKVDTGMTRLGFQPNDEAIEDIKTIFKLPNIIVEGIFTHFAVADEKDKEYTYMQFNKYMDFTNKLEKEGYEIPIKHVSNSAAIIDLPEMNLDMVRPGIILYGLYPSKHVNKDKIDLKQVMELKARVSHVKTVPKERGISYGLKYTTKEAEKIITIPIGYADGYTRMMSGKAEILAKENKIPVVGRICMDQCMANATGLDINPGDEVTLYSRDRNSGISIDDIADKLDTINYEIVCMVGKRVPRVYMENNNLLQINDSLLV